MLVNERLERDIVPTNFEDLRIQPMDLTLKRWVKIGGNIA